VSVQRHVAYCLRRKLEEFDIDSDGLIRTLRRSQAIIVGLFPLVCLLPIAYGAEVVDNIDFVAPMNSFHNTVREVTGNTRYRRCEPQHAPIQRNRRVRSIESYRIYKRRPEIPKLPYVRRPQQQTLAGVHLLFLDNAHDERDHWLGYILCLCRSFRVERRIEEQPYAYEKIQQECSTRRQT